MSLETPQGVTSESPTEQVVTDQTVETTAAETTPTQEGNEQPQVESQETTQTAQAKLPELNADLYDERGVPWKNVALEHRRKYEEAQASLPKQIAEEVAKLQQTQQKPTYTIGELEKYAQDNPEHRPWVEQEKARILREEVTREVEAKIQATTKAQQDEMVRRDTFNSVVSKFPELIIRDQQGNFIGWNNISPMTQAVGRYMSSQDLANRPDGLMIAAKLAYADLAFQKAPTQAKTIQNMKSQIRKAQAQTFVEGGGRKPGAENPNRKFMERVRTSGRAEDASPVMRNILKAQGMIKE